MGTGRGALGQSHSGETNRGRSQPLGAEARRTGKSLLAGTGRKAFIGTNYHVAGKSGTAQVFSLKENQKYNAAGLKKELHDHAWFTAYAPYEDPKLVVTIILENAGGGSSNAAPIVRQIMDFYLNKRLPQIERLENAEKEKKTNQTDLDAPALESQPSENE